MQLRSNIKSANGTVYALQDTIQTSVAATFIDPLNNHDLNIDNSFIEHGAAHNYTMPSFVLHGAAHNFVGPR